MIRLVLTTARTSWRVIPHTGLAAKCTHYPLRFLRFMLGEAQCDLFGPRSHITSELELKSTKRSNAILQQLLKIITMDTNNDGDDGDELSTLETEIQRLRVEISETVGRELHPRGNVDDSGAKDIAKEEDTSRMNCPLRKQLQLEQAPPSSGTGGTCASQKGTTGCHRIGHGSSVTVRTCSSIRCTASPKLAYMPSSGIMNAAVVGVVTHASR
jgi:hypothetical protein